MKKTIIILVAILSSTAVWAQDTVDGFIRDSYFFNYIPDLKKTIRFSTAPSSGDGCGVMAKEMYASKETPLRIYGIAASLTTPMDLFYIPDDPSVDPAMWWEEFFSWFGDTTTANLYEYLGLYRRDGDSLALQKDVMVHRRHDTPAYYVQYGYYNYNPNFCYPIYEKYFDSSLYVVDTFYLGVTQRTRIFGRSPTPLYFSLVALNGEGVQDIHEYHPRQYCYGDEGDGWYWPPRLPMDDSYFVLFPILTPDPDNPGNDPGEEPGEEPGETTGVTAADLVSRYVTVQPNPATEEARVLSSFGIEGVEVFDAEGRRVAELRGEGLEARIDVRGWAAGSYLLRVATPLGATTKKLLVR